MDPTQPTLASSPRRARLTEHGHHVTGPLPVIGHVGRHRATKATRPEHRAARFLVGRSR